jgi:creatinine amidohydrolase
LNTGARKLTGFSTAELERYLQKDTLCIIPLGATEQHGPHLPLGTDTLISELVIDQLCEVWKEDLQLLIFPVLPLGVSTEHDSYCGTVSVSVSSLQSIIGDMCLAIRRWGFKKALVINFHGGNSDTVSSILREIRDRTGVLCCATHVYKNEVLKGFGSAQDYHAGDIETSILLRYAPGLVRKECLPERPAGPGVLEKMKLFRNLDIPWFTKDLSVSGVIGKPSEAGLEKGEAIIEALVCELIEVIDQVKSYET